MAHNFPAERFFNRAAFNRQPSELRAISGAMCCEVLERGRRIVGLQRQFHLTERLTASFPCRVFQSLQSPKLRQSYKSLDQPIVWPLDANVGEQSWFRRRQWRVQSSLSDWRASLDSVRSQASVLTITRKRDGKIASYWVLHFRDNQ